MARKGIKSVDDVLAFFRAFNTHDWDAVFNYMRTDCIWDASEKRLVGKEELINYWTNYHASFKETLGKPEHIILGNQMVYLQVPIHIEILAKGKFLDQWYNTGDTVDIQCADFYELDEEGMIISGRVFVKPPHN